MTTDSAAKFDPERAAAYEQQSRIGLAGYDACHELAASVLAAAIGRGKEASVLVVGAGGTAKEILTAAALEPGWRFTAVDPSPAMLELAVGRIAEAELSERVEPILGYVEDVAECERFGAATLIGVIHHLHGDEAKLGVLRGIAARLKPGAPLILAGNHLVYADHPLLLEAWKERWRLMGVTSPETLAKFETMLASADPPESESAVEQLLGEAGFERPVKFFGSLFWGAWVAFNHA